MSPTKIAYHGLEPSEALTALIHERIDQLGELTDRISSVRVVVDSPHQHQRHGRAYDVRVEIHVAGHDVVLGSSAGEPEAEDDPYQAVRRAFDHVRRQLTASQTRDRGKQRAHEASRASIRNGR